MISLHFRTRRNSFKQNRNIIKILIFYLPFDSGQDLFDESDFKEFRHYSSKMAGIRKDFKNQIKEQCRCNYVVIDIFF